VVPDIGDDPFERGLGRPGVELLGDGRCRLLVWAPRRRSVELHVLTPAERLVPLDGPDDAGYFHAVVDDVPAGSRYLLRLDGDVERPDPASRLQPETVHGPSEVVDGAAFRWTDGGWRPPALGDMVMYEAHPGTFTPEGTFAGMVTKLDHLAALGVDALEVMPIAQFPGARNWGYDGAAPYAVQSSYGGPDGFRALVDACHARGIAVILDVVYNHLGPEGNYLDEFAPYFTDKYQTPWGRAINFDGPWSDEVRHYFIENARYWLQEFHVDGLRLDAIHGIFDRSAHPFLRELAERTRELEREAGRPYLLIAESDLNDARIILPWDRNGYGLDAQWSDDFHHSVHALLTGERQGYYQDFGEPAHVVKALTEGYVYSGQRSGYRKRRHGNAPDEIPPSRLVVAVQNHDQVGNRMRGERLTALVGFEQLKLAAGLLLLSPSVPMLFMGEEYGEPAPFLYFVSHSDEELSALVRKGRAEEFKAFGWAEEPPDPTHEATFRASRLDWDLLAVGHHAVLHRLYRELIRLRRELPSPAASSRDDVEARVEGSVIFLRRRLDSGRTLAVFNAGPHPYEGEVPAGVWRLLIDSAAEAWGGPGSAVADELQEGARLPVAPHSFVCLAGSAGS
jgi:maltooligosyltrehalose trehalohydrolase